nr:hypothetical protein [uncultured Rhodopila sp.]
MVACFRAGRVSGLGGMPGDPGHGFADRGLGVGHRAAGGDVQIVDSGAAQGQGADAEARAAAAARKTATSAARPGGQGRPKRSHQSHKARTPAR